MRQQRDIPEHLGAVLRDRNLKNSLPACKVGAGRKIFLAQC
jgi:hypothetical protein